MTFDYFGKATEVLIVGGSHLTSAWTDESLKTTKNRLVAWKPDVVAIEVLPGEVVDRYLRLGGWVTDLKYGGFPRARKIGGMAQEITGWNQVEAARAAELAEPHSAERVLAYLAALEPWNALLHWCTDQQLPDPVNEHMLALSQNPSESVRLGVAVARMLGHQKLCLFDEFPEEEMSPELWEEFMTKQEIPAFQAWIEGHPFLKELRQVETQGMEAQDYWHVLRQLNTEQTTQRAFAFETEANLKCGLGGRAKQADWDTRNLQMAARLRAATISCPAGRILVIVGHSHKGPLEAALGALGPDLNIVSFSEVDYSPGSSPHH